MSRFADRGRLGLVGLIVLLTASCGWPSPADPYDHQPRHETSVAVPVGAGGQIGVVTAGLARVGFFCAQVRADDQARQVWCRAAVDPRDDRQDRDVTVVDLITTADGTIAYADVVLPAATTATPTDPGRVQRLHEVLAASFLTLWPADTGDVDASVDHVAAGGPGLYPDKPHRPVQQVTSTRHARYVVGEGTAFGDGVRVSDDPVLSFSLTTSANDGLGWPDGGADYATTTTVAGPGLEAGGFDCYGPEQSPCTRPAGNQEIDYRTARGSDQVVSVQFFVPGSVDPLRTPGLADSGFPQGLTFLVPGVRTAVEEQVLVARRSGQRFVGLVAGAVVVIEPPLRTGRGMGAQPVSVTVGVPLIELVTGRA